MLAEVQALAAYGVLGPVAASMVDPFFTTPLVFAWVTAGMIDLLMPLFASAWVISYICKS